MDYPLVARIDRRYTNIVLHPTILRGQAESGKDPGREGGKQRGKNSAAGSRDHFRITSVRLPEAQTQFDMARVVHICYLREGPQINPVRQSSACSALLCLRPYHVLPKCEGKLGS